MDFQSISQPTKNSTLDVIIKTISTGKINSLDMAFAYATSGGVYDFIKAGSGSLGDTWNDIPKRWTVSFDYLRTEPNALKMLYNTPNSNLRIHNASFVLRNKGAAKCPYHPKIVLIESENSQSIIAGSGNLSRSGLNSGYEAGLAVSGNLNGPDSPKNIKDNYSLMRSWYNENWDLAEPYSPDLFAAYEKLYQSASNLKNPVPTEDDYFPFPIKAGQLSPLDLRKLRACKFLWIQTGNVTKNLGKNRPGNQLMMKKLTRVFFGVPVLNVPQNSPLKKISVKYGDYTKHDCSLTFSDNGMDKLTLPIPGENGVPAYDNQIVLFERVSAGSFLLKLGTISPVRKWEKNSNSIQASFKMSGSGRKWGVF